MSAGRWVPSPRQYPSKCFLTGLSSREHGPYLEIDPTRPYIDPQTRREGRMYWCFASWRSTVVDPDSPYAIILEEAVQQRVADLTERIAMLEAELASDPVRVAVAKLEKQLHQPTQQEIHTQPKPRPPKRPKPTPEAA